ncbi:MAG: winged helix DNA-binding domain-containing protein [Thermoplasmata archaeon]
MKPKATRPVGTPVSRDQVTAFRLQRHHLLERAPRWALVSVLGEMGGAQAQLFTAAQTSLWARTRDLGAGDVEQALWKDRRITKAWCMRRTVHLLPSRNLATFVRGTTRRAERDIRWALNRGMPKAKLEEVLAVVLSVLDRPITRPEIAERVSRALSIPRSSAQYAGWGSRREVACVVVAGLTFPADFLLHLAAARGVVCAGPGEEGESTYVRADAWIPHWSDAAVERAEEELLRLYLRSFGPATPSDFKAWTQMLLSDARGIWARVEPDLARVEVEGDAAWLLRSDLAQLERSELGGSSVRLLPYFDSFLLGHEGRRHLLEVRHHRKVYRPAGWIAPALLVNGRVAGTWGHTQKGRRLDVCVTRFSPFPAGVVPQVRTEAQELGRFLGASEVTVSIR